jgi:alkanesulfonate monooxygenase SsuD/methylene tetrahydromethanopterin reductase-like flavin-dependent oxidoreductase (luciferase family)
MEEDVVGTAPVKVGFRPPHQLFRDGAAAVRRAVEEAEDLGIDQLCVGDHVSFQGGQGFDGLIHATALAMASTTLEVHTAVYLLALRHPLPVARQVSSLAELAPGRFVFGVGVGGDDRHELEVCGVDPRTRGRRTDESLRLVRSLLTEESVTHHGQFFDLVDARIRPRPRIAVPVVVGGRSEAALHRAALLGDGWLGIWVSPERFADVTARVQRDAIAAGRSDVPSHHEMQFWCGFGASADEATPRVTEAMERLYRTPFAKFDRYTPRGTPEEVAAQLAPFVAAGCRTINLIPIGADAATVVKDVAAVRRLLNDVSA